MEASVPAVSRARFREGSSLPGESLDQGGVASWEGGWGDASARGGVDKTNTLANKLQHGAKCATHRTTHLHVFLTFFSVPIFDSLHSRRKVNNCPHIAARLLKPYSTFIVNQCAEIHVR
jgi:hypothetical protein